MDALKLLSRSTGLKTKIANPPRPNLPSASGAAKELGEPDIPSSRKRKRTSRAGENDVASPPRLSEDEIRLVQTKHKIKIVDLNKYRAGSESDESRKAHKEHSRLFPRPLISFDQLHAEYGVNPAVRRNLSEQAFAAPTEVQIATLPLLLRASHDDALEKPDLLTVAPTGSGKTLAFLIPLIDDISKAHRAAPAQGGRHVRAIILAPTKELVSQLVNEGRKLCRNTGVTISAMRKGMHLLDGPPSSEGRPENEDGDDEESERDRDDEDEGSVPTAGLIKSDIVVATPLSLVHALCPSWESDETIPGYPLPNVETLVLDEADVLLDPLFRAQTLAIWSACVSPALRISLWSATIGSNIEELAVHTIAQRQKRLKIRRRQRPAIFRTVIGLKDTSLPTISHRLIYTATESGKLLGMRQLLHPSRSTPISRDTGGSDRPPRPPFLVFTQTISRAQSLHTELQYDIPASAGGPSRVAVLHSSLSNRARSTVMDNFRQGKIWVLITTDLLSRGVDFRGVNVVVNYDIPTTVAGYVHRAGRTGRAGRDGGVCVSFYTKEDIQYVKSIANVIAATEKSQTKAAGQSVADGARTVDSSTAVQPWLLHALPSVSKSAKKNLKMHGVESRRAIHADDNEAMKRMKRKARIGTQSGYERQKLNRRLGAVEASQQAKRTQPTLERDLEEWMGFE